MKTTLRLGLVLGTLLALAGCDNEPMVTPDAATGPTDAGACVPFMVPTVMDPGAPPAMVTCSTMAPDPGTQMGPCCYRLNQSTQRDSPEMRIRHITLNAPVGSTLASPVVLSLLNSALEDESFNWLFRIEGMGGDGPVNIVTGFGVRDPAGTYAFDLGPEFAGGEFPPVTIPATATGDRVQSSEFDGSVTVPVLNEAGTEVQIELTLRNLQIVDSYASVDRSCVGGWTMGRTWIEPASLTAYITVEDARSGTIVIPSPAITTTLCAAIAGGLNNAAYCDENVQADWTIQPDSLCTATGCERNPGCGDTSVCDPATTCNAWYLAGTFAAQGIDITN